VKIARVEVFEKTYHVEPAPFAMSGGRVVGEQYSTIVRIEADTGEVGWGEQCTFSPAYLPGHAQATQAAIPLLSAAILGCDPREVDKVHDRMDEALVGHEYAKSALDIACWDLLGVATGLRVSELLGGTRCEDVPLYKAVSLGEPERMRDRAAEIQANGYRLLQVKVGDAWQDDVERVTQCLSGAPAMRRVVVDANGHWSQHEAIRAAWHLRELDICLEQPCRTAAECSAVRQQTGRPMVLDECLTGPQELLAAVRLGGLDVARLKLSRWGGITPLRKARDLCLALGIGISVEDSAGGDVVTAAIVHLASSIPADRLFDTFMPSGEVREHVAVEPLVPIGGHARVPQGPGLGVEVDLAQLGQPVGRFQ
jgi:cis-L-3-hydroxyproline dehydratase